MPEENPLSEEISFFEANLEAWLHQYRGRVALVKGHELIGVYDVESDALKVGAQNFGTGPYLIRRVLKEQPSYKNLALSLGLISNATHP